MPRISRTNLAYFIPNLIYGRMDIAANIKIRNWETDYDGIRRNIPRELIGISGIYLTLWKMPER